MKKKEITKRPLRKIRPFTVLILFLIALSFTLFFSFLPIDLTDRAPQVKSWIEARINGRVEFSRMVLRVLPYPNITLESFALSDGKETVIKAENVKAGFSLLPFIFKKINVKKLTVDNAYILVRIDAAGKTNLEKIRKDERYAVELRNLRLRDSNIRVIDGTHGDAAFEMDHVKAYLSQTPGGTTYSGTGRLKPGGALSFSGEARRVGAEVKHSGTLKVEDLDVATASPYLKKEDLGGLEVIDGRLGAELSYSFSREASSVTAGVVKGTLTAKKLEVRHPGLFTKALSPSEALASVDMTWRDGNIAVALNDARVKLESFDISGSVRAGLPSMSIEVILSTTAIPLAYLKEVFVPEAMPEAVKRTTAGLKNTSGEVTVKKLVLSVPPANQTTSTANQPATLAVSLDAVFKDAGFSHPRFERPFSALNGEVSFEDNTFTFRGLSGNYGHSAVRAVDGTLSLSGAPGIRQGRSAGKLKVDADVDCVEALAELRKITGLTVLMKASLAGRVRLKVSAEGILPAGVKAESGLVFKTSADLTDASIRYGGAVEKNPGYPARFEGLIRVGPDDTVIEDGRVSFGSSSGVVRGRLSNTGASHTIDVSSDGAAVRDIVDVSPYFIKDSPSHGTVSLNVRSVKKAKGRHTALSGEGKLTSGLFTMRSFPRVMRDVEAAMKLDGNTARISISSLKTGESELSGRIDLTDVEGRVADFNLLFRGFNTADFFKSGSSGAPEASPGHSPASMVTGKGRITAREGFLHGISFKNLSADITITSEGVHLKPVAFTSHDGQVSGELTYMRSDTNPLLFEAGFRVSMMDVESLIRELGAKDRVLSGRLTADIKLRDRRTDPLTSGLDGEINILTKDGKLWKFVVFSKIFSIVNIISITELFDSGLPYDTITGGFVIKDGRVSTEDLLLASSSIRMSAVGVIDIPKMTIESTMGLHPFVTIDKIISNIPLAGWIIAGREKSTITMYYEMKGPLKDPQVVPIPVEGIGKQILGIFERVLTTPIRVMEPLMPEKPEEKQTEGQDKKSNGN
ncbi:MAG: AsmA-like C-terminal domain-containing protein [Deltaproteobacteria bacterium]|nr:AsmA-like C-terminal domain-containing protein [Deltaproteobacteria bacterium]